MQISPHACFPNDDVSWSNTICALWFPCVADPKTLELNSTALTIQRSDVAVGQGYALYSGLPPRATYFGGLFPWARAPKRVVPSSVLQKTTWAKCLRVSKISLRAAKFQSVIFACLDTRRNMLVLDDWITKHSWHHISNKMIKIYLLFAIVP